MDLLDTNAAALRKQVYDTQVQLAISEHVEVKDFVKALPGRRKGINYKAGRLRFPVHSANKAGGDFRSRTGLMPSSGTQELFQAETDAAYFFIHAKLPLLDIQESAVTEASFRSILEFVQEAIPMRAAFVLDRAAMGIPRQGNSGAVDFNGVQAVVGATVVGSTTIRAAGPYGYRLGDYATWNPRGGDAFEIGESIIIGTRAQLLTGGGQLAVVTGKSPTDVTAAGQLVTLDRAVTVTAAVYTPGVGGAPGSIVGDMIVRGDDIVPSKHGYKQFPSGLGHAFLRAVEGASFQGQNVSDIAAGDYSYAGVMQSHNPAVPGTPVAWNTDAVIRIMAGWLNDYPGLAAAKNVEILSHWTTQDVYRQTLTDLVRLDAQSLRGGNKALTFATFGRDIKWTTARRYPRGMLAVVDHTSLQDADMLGAGFHRWKEGGLLKDLTEQHAALMRWVHAFQIPIFQPAGTLLITDIAVDMTIP